MSVTERVDTVIVGAGFSGLAMGAKLKRAGREDFVIIERAGDVGGVWRDNTYPGAACDVPSHVYSLSFAPNPSWSRTYSHQPEIHAYLRRVARDEDLERHIVLDCELLDARWDDDHYEIETTRGTIRARALVAAAGPLVEPKLPDVPGLVDFQGEVFHSARWDHDVDLAGKRVAVVGTGASAIQFIPEIVDRVGRMTVFQRTAPWVLPRSERPISRAERELFRRAPATQAAIRKGVFWMRELGAGTPLFKPRQPSVLAALGKAHLRRQVADPVLREKLTPRYEPGCKRLLLSNTYYPALTRPHVDVLATGLAEVRGNTVVGADGSTAEVDVIIFGTGFEVTRPPVARHIRGREGITLDQHWGGSMTAHRGTTVHGFPNLFFLLGPNTGTGHMSVIYMAEAQADYVLDALSELDVRGDVAVEPTPEAQDAWTEHVQRLSQGTVWLGGGCASWYLDDAGRNTTLWPTYAYRYADAVSSFRPVEHAFQRRMTVSATRRETTITT
jgi:cation diffusion facilitator CzcD-associated flavoprotein CzcO